MEGRSVETSQTAADEYNQAHFGQLAPTDQPNNFRRVNPIGNIAPDFPAVRLGDLAQVKLSDYLGHGHVVLEFGSVT